MVHRDLSLSNKITLSYGGVSKSDLLENLQSFGVMLNDFARILFSSDLFKTSAQPGTIQIISLSVDELGFAEGATMPEIKDRIKILGLTECPLEAAPYLRLILSDQEEITDDLKRKNQNPLGSVTIFSEPLIDDDDFPKGFYLKKTDGKLWLRGYTCSMDYVWKPDDKMIFKTG
jgi:hypothetical protein